MSKPLVKICGVKTPEIIRHCAKSGVRLLGFVFVEKSPRFIDKEAARWVVQTVPTGIKSVGLFVDPDDQMLDYFLSVPLDMIQLHGSESPERVAEIKAKTHLPIIKAFGIRHTDDFEAIKAYADLVDWVLLDAKPASSGNSSLTGGHGLVFDWSLLKNFKCKKPVMISGGLTAENVNDLLAIYRPQALDISSGVEEQKGVKSPTKIDQFMKAISQ
jgi:phosphoribosylanthranilate isomerase